MARRVNAGRRVAMAATVSVVLVLSGTAVLAQARDPAYAAARASGEVGEESDGYLGTVGAGSPTLRHMVEDINIRRKAVYSQRAQAQHATVEEYAFTAGCLLVAQTEPGEKYKAPGGSWQTRGAGPLMRDPRCP